MNKTITGILTGIILVLISFLIYTEYYKVPKLERELNNWKNAPVEVDTHYVKGDTDTLWLAKPGTEFKPTSGSPVLTSNIESAPPAPEKESEEIPQEIPEKTYETSVGDSLLKGTIYNTVIGEGYLADADLTYSFKKPIYTSMRIDTVYETRTRTVLKFVPEERPIRLQIGGMLGASPDGTIYWGPSVGILNKEDHSLTYSYDVANGGHFVTYRRTIRFPKIDLNPFN